MKKLELDPTQPVELTYTPDFQDTPFIVFGDYEAVEPIAAHVQALDARQQASRVSHVEAPVAAPSVKPDTIDLSTLDRKEVLRRKINAYFYDRRNGTDMLGLLNERIADDRNVAMAQRLGIISSVHCLKHQKAVDKLRGML